MRVFVDKDGTEWTAWAVRLARGPWTGQERRVGRERRRGADVRTPDADVTAFMAGAPSAESAAGMTADGQPFRTRGPERRGRAALRAVRTLGPSLGGGWLAFQAGTERRRLAPIPDGWEDTSDEALRALCKRAAPAPPAVTPLAQRGRI